MRANRDSFDSITGYFRWDRARLDQALGGVIAKAAKGDLRQIERAFGHYERGLRRHLRIKDDMILELFAFDRSGAGRAPTRELQDEHDEIIRHLDTMRAALGAHDLAGFAASAATLQTFIGAHNARSEELLYPLFDSLLGGAEARTMIKRLRAA